MRVTVLLLIVVWCERPQRCHGLSSWRALNDDCVHQQMRGDLRLIAIVVGCERPQTVP